jgi:hypothetical protein
VIGGLSMATGALLIVVEWDQRALPLLFATF